MNESQFNTILKITTAAGSLPLIFFLFLPTVWWTELQALAITYVAVILSFVAGISWLSGCLEKNGYLIIWAVILSLITWLLIFYCWISATYVVIWIVTIILVNFTWLVDWLFYRDNKVIINFRFIGSLSLNIAIVAIIVRSIFL